MIPSKEDIEKIGERIAEGLGYNIHSLSMEVLNVKTAAACGYKKGLDDNKEIAIGFVEFLIDNGHLEGNGFGSVYFEDRNTNPEQLFQSYLQTINNE